MFDIFNMLKKDEKKPAVKQVTRQTIIGDILDMDQTTAPYFMEIGMHCLGCTEPLRDYYARQQEADSRTAGNGRLARNTLEKAIFHQSRRLVAEPSAPLDVILPSDLELDL